MNQKTIRTGLFVAALTCAAAACSNGNSAGAGYAGLATLAGAQAGGDMPAGAVAQVADADMAAAGAHPAPLPGAAGQRRASFADVPDRGDLVAYPDERVVRRAGPYTWHRADVSEAHALHAIAGGILALTTPAGQRLEFQYERHIEHDTGDWTWIGRAVGGGPAQEAILTFGQASVFGTISQPGQAALNLITEDGASWLVETDRAARAAQSEASGRYDRPDFLLPRDMPVVEGLRAQAAMATAGAAASGTTVDVLIGYTAGFAAAHSWMANTAGIMTRLNYLVDVTNESYVNSQVDASIRLVHTMQVNYTDANGNATALSELTGSDGSTPDPAQVHTALQPLHAARNQYGADLVALVRDFQHPEAVNCGVAWLLGGGRREFGTEYAPFGMAVVSDGADGSFFCEDTTFAHELGHNMGLAHDVTTAMGDDGTLDDDDYGRFTYSFGYRTGVGQGNFHTVMAYEDGDQTGYRVFSNPDVLCGGVPCGLADAADNARTLRETIGIIGGFRATVVTEPEPAGYVRDDIDGDGDSDLTWRNNAETRFAYWLLDGATVTGSKTYNVASQWSLVAKGDLNGDGIADLVWSNGSTLYLWAGDGASYDASRIGGLPSGWSVFGAGDVDGDGNDDLIFRNTAQTRVAYWTMDGATRLGSATFGASSAWQLEIADDLSGDGRVDLVWTNGSRLVLWTSTGTGFDSAAMRSHPSGWQLVDSGDVDGDGDADLHWRNNAADRYSYWLMDGATLVDGHTWQVGPAWTLAAVGDYNGDGYADLTWTSSSRVVQWAGTGQGFTNANVRTYPTGWTLLR